MMIISERLNGMFNAVGKALDERDAETLQNMAREQVELGAHALDLNTGSGRENSAADMEWMVKTVQEVVNVPLVIDSPKMDVLIAGVKASTRKCIINSTTAAQAKMDKLFPLAAEYDSDIICLTMNEDGVPNDENMRAELAMLIVATAMGYGIDGDRLYIDPVVLPIKAAQDQGRKMLNAMTMFKSLCSPPPKTVVGLSNISNGATERPLINRTYLAMLCGNGLDAAIADPYDRELVDVAKTCDILNGEKLYADSYLRT